MKRKLITIVHNSKIFSVLPNIEKDNVEVYCLSDDYTLFNDLQKKMPNGICVLNLEGLFDRTFQKIKKDVLNMFFELNSKFNSYGWWGNLIASKSTSANPLIRNIVVLFCAEKIILRVEKNILFVTDSRALSKCLVNLAVSNNFSVKNYDRKISQLMASIKLCLFPFAQAILFSYKTIQNRRAALKIFPPYSQRETKFKKRVVVRSWVTNSTFDKNERFEDRNFGILPEWLRAKNYEIWTLPMFFNLSDNIEKVYALMKNQKENFLIADHYLKFSDYFEVLWQSFKGMSKKVDVIEIKNLNVAPLIEEDLKRLGINVGLCLLNLCAPMLKRLKECGFEMDGFYYSFECNAPENQFVMACRKFFPLSKIIGFQHTTFFSNQLTYHLADRENEVHPLPDKIICSGPMYEKLLEGAGFSKNILLSGSNLRFKTVYLKDKEKKISSNGKKIILLPLTNCHNLAFELFCKVNEALVGTEGYRVIIRLHPLLSKKKINDFLENIKMRDHELVDTGIIQENLSQASVVISSGGSITILEAMAMAVPVIRIIPDNTFFYDPFHLKDYPLPPISNSLEVKKQLHYIYQLQKSDKKIYSEMAKKVLQGYFTKPNEENLQVFLLNTQKKNKCLLSQ